jgi:hypothetical protein
MVRVSPPHARRGSGRCAEAPVTSAHRFYPDVVMAPHTPASDARRMQVIASRRGRPRPISVVGVLFGGLGGAILLVLGVVLGWFVFATPILHGFTVPPRPTMGEMAIGAFVWTTAIVLPAALVIGGCVRLVVTTERLARFRARRGAATGLGSVLGAEYIVATDVILPDGAVIPEIVVGPHGAAVIETAPPPSVTRHRDERWEALFRDRGWLPMENPLDRASRDAERVRRWFASDDRDFVIHVHAALVTADKSLERSATCATISRDEVAPWLLSLPAQRSFSALRREYVAGVIAEHV